MTKKNKFKKMITQSKSKIFQKFPKFSKNVKIFYRFSKIFQDYPRDVIEAF